MKGSIEQVMESGALGVKIECAGRLGGAEIARTERLFKGKLPLHTLRANIDFARITAYTTYGTIGIKVRSEEHTSELQSPDHLVCRLLLEKKKQTNAYY